MVTLWREQATSRRGGPNGAASRLQRCSVRSLPRARMRCVTNVAPVPEAQAAEANAAKPAFPAGAWPALVHLALNCSVPHVIEEHSSPIAGSWGGLVRCEIISWPREASRSRCGQVSEGIVPASACGLLSLERACRISGKPIFCRRGDKVMAGRAQGLAVCV